MLTNLYFVNWFSQQGTIFPAQHFHFVQHFLHSKYCKLGSFGKHFSIFSTLRSTQIIYISF